MRVVVVGAGIVGMSTTLALLRAGADVVCLESAGVVMGERSAGSSRIFRLAHAAPELIRYAVTAREGFARWSATAGAPMVDPVGCVVTGADAEDRARALASQGAPHRLLETADGLGLPARTPSAPALVDSSGGVVDVDAVRRFLCAEAGSVVAPDAAVRVSGSGTEGSAAPGLVATSSGTEHVADAVVLAAGAGTPALAASVGIDLPRALEHHVRFTFAFDDAASHPAWIDRPAEGPSTYQHRTGPGRWSVGATLDARLVAWDGGRDAATTASRDAVVEYVRERLTVDPAVVDELYCSHAPDTGDGIRFRRAGPVLAVYGENLMKFAPVLGETLAAAVLDGSTPADLG